VDYLKDVLNGEHIIYLGLIATAALSIWALIAKLRPKVGDLMTKAARQIVQLGRQYDLEDIAHAKIFAKLEELSGDMKEIRIEMKPNGGTSIRDSLNRVEAMQAYQGAFQMSSLHTWEKAIFITDAQGAVTYVNRAHSRLTGFRPDECMGHEWINVIDPKERNECMQAWKDSVTQGIVFDKVITYVKPGNIDPYKVSVHAVRIQSHGDDANLHGYMGEVKLLTDD